MWISCGWRGINGEIVDNVRTVKEEDKSYERKEDNIRLPPARTQVGTVNQQSKGQGEIKQSINPESHILKSMGTLPVQFPNPHKECGTEEKQITFFITEIVMNEP